MSFVKEFKEFAMRGNVIDMAGRRKFYGFKIYAKRRGRLYGCRNRKLRLVYTNDGRFYDYRVLYFLRR